MPAVNIIVRLLLLCGCIACSTCAPDPVSGGTSTSENGRVAGLIVSEGGFPAPCTQVTLIHELYDPVRDSVTLPTDTTDDSGRFSFSGIDHLPQCKHLCDPYEIYCTGTTAYQDIMTKSNGASPSTTYGSCVARCAAKPEIPEIF